MPRLRRRQNEDDVELTDPLPDKLRSSVVSDIAIQFYFYIGRSCWV